MLKKSLSILLALLLTISLLPAAAADEGILASGECGPHADWSLSADGRLTVIGYGNLYDYAPGNRPAWYERRDEIQSVYIDPYVTRVGSYAFADCGALTEVSFPYQSLTIGSSAFSGCSSLSLLRFGAFLKSVEPSAFAGCGALSEIWFSGRESSWNSAAIAEGNDALQGAQLHLAQGAPVITAAPQSVLAQAGETVRLSVETEGEYICQYYWQYMTSRNDPSDETLWSNCTNGRYSSLEVKAESFRNGYHYRCKVYNGLGLTVTDYITLSVGLPITVQPEDARIEEGQTASFTVGAEGVTAYQWQYRTNSNGSWNNCSGSGAKTATLTVAGKAYRNGYEYRCQLSAGEIQTVSRIAALRVVSRPVIVAQPKPKTVVLNKNAVFRVSATDAYSFQWQYSPAGSSAWNNCSGNSAQSASLFVEGKAYRSGYRYRCVVKNEFGSSTVSEPATLTVIGGAPQILSQPASVSAEAGDTAVFAVEALDAERYQWYYQTPAGQGWNYCSAAGSDSPRLCVEALAYRDGYQYRCLIYNICGTIYSDAATLHVTARTAPTILTQPEPELLAAAGETVTLTVEASGSAPLRYQWYYCTPTSGYWNKCSSGTGASLAVEAKAYRNGYQYRCLVQNSSGKVYSDPVTLRVQ